MRICWDSFYPCWHIGKPKEEDAGDVAFEICLGCFHIYFWKKEEDM